MAKHIESSEQSCNKCGVVNCTGNASGRVMAPCSFANETYAERKIASPIEDCPGLNGDTEKHEKFLTVIGLIRLAIQHKDNNQAKSGK